jgi:monothiol glutaredoxin
MIVAVHKIVGHDILRLESKVHRHFAGFNSVAEGSRISSPSMCLKISWREPSQAQQTTSEVHMMDVMDRIKEQVENNPIVIYMKGTPQFPMCGFSSRAAAALQDCGVPFAYVNVLADPEIFENLPRYADWPTFPQIYISGELIGGCDITLEMHQTGELKTMMQEATTKAASTGDNASE